MLSQNVANISSDAFMQKSAGKKVVLLYPWVNYRNVFLSYFLSGSSPRMLYYRIPQDGVSVSGWLAGLLDEIRLIEAGFGEGLASALQAGETADFGAALAADLAGVSDGRVTLFLDELDRVKQDNQFRQVISALVENLSEGSQLVVNSRLLTFDPWMKWVHRDEAVVMGAGRRSNNLVFTKNGAVKPQLEVFAFGRGHAVSNGKEIKTWDGALPRNLFFYFMDNPLVTRDQVFEIFWPKLSIRDATNVFHVTKRKITERISMHVDDEESYELTNYSTGFYVPSGKIARHYDVADFEQTMEGALLSSDLRERQTLYRQAIDMYKAPFLYPLKLPWVVRRRKQLQAMYGEALNGMARSYVDQQAWDAALGFFMRALRELPQREDIHRGAMQMYINLGRDADAREHYSVLERLLKRSLGVTPSSDTQALLRRLN